MPLALPSREAIALAIDNGTSEDYHLVRLYYSWYAGWFYRHRLKMAADLLGDTKLNRILEVGTGSGIFIKELLKHADLVTGIDIHATYHGVQAMLGQEEVEPGRVELKQGSIFDIPYQDGHFDAAVCISVLEHFPDPGPALREMRRVVRPGGLVVTGFPARNRITERLFRLLGYDDRKIHPASHNVILAAMRAALSVDVVRAFPLPQVPLYVVCRARRKA
jgi:ubiquinone/menaquinone biosynthesis C-methylase UbiE